MYHQYRLNAVKVPPQMNFKKLTETAIATTARCVNVRTLHVCLSLCRNLHAHTFPSFRSPRPNEMRWNVRMIGHHFLTRRISEIDLRMFGQSLSTCVESSPETVNAFIIHSNIVNQVHRK